MAAIGAQVFAPYPRCMPKAGSRGSARKRVYPNRIFELNKLHGFTYADIGERVGKHEVTIARIANGELELTHSFMKELAPVYGVDPSEIIENPPSIGLRRVRVKGAIEAGAWAENHEWPPDSHYDVYVPDEPRLRGVELYGGEIRGESMNLRYKHGSVVVCSRISGQSPGQIVEGRRYHVRHTHSDGTSEETIKTLVRDAKGEYWLKPESTDPQFQEWISLDGRPGSTIELLGWVRYTIQRED